MGNGYITLVVMTVFTQCGSFNISRNYISAATAGILQPETDSACCGHRTQQILFFIQEAVTDPCDRSIQDI